MYVWVGIITIFRDYPIGYQPNLFFVNALTDFPPRKPGGEKSDYNVKAARGLRTGRLRS